MKQSLLMFLAISMFACAKPVVVTFSTSYDTVRLETNDIQDQTRSASVEWDCPVATSSESAIAELINKTIADSLARNTDAPTFAAAAKIAEQYSKDSINYSSIVEWNGYQSKNIISIMLTSYIYSGGAHGNTIQSGLTFDAQTGQSIDIRSHITDKDAFLKLFIDAYIKAYDINTNSTSSDLGYFVEIDSLWIPNTLILTTDGITGYYQQYEIACYAVGITSATVPYDKLKGVLTLDVADIKPIEIAK